MLYSISRIVLKFFLKIFFNLKIIGRENLPREGPYIVACNHTSYLDPPVLGASIPRIARFLARENLFKKGLLGWWMRNIGCIPVKHSKRDIKAMREALKFLNKGRILAIFPEGARSIDGSLKEAKAGMGFLAFKTKAPIVPAYIKGSKDALPKHSKSFKLKPIRIYFGKKIESTDFGETIGSKSFYERMSQEVMDKISQLKKDCGD